MTEQRDDDSRDTAASTPTDASLTAEERDEVLDDEHVARWNNGPSGEQVPEWLERRNSDEDTPPESGQDS